MVKIVILDKQGIYEKTIRDVEGRIEQKEDNIIYFNSIDDLRKILTKERINLLRMVRAKKPGSIYELAKLLGKDFKTVITDARILETVGLVNLDMFKTGMRIRAKPTVLAKKIVMEIAL